MVAEISWVFKKKIFLSLSKIRGLMRGLLVSADIRSKCWSSSECSTSVIVSSSVLLCLPFPSYCWCLCLEEDCMWRKKQIKNKMLWSMHDLLMFISYSAHMMVAHILAVWRVWSPCLLLSILLPQYQVNAMVRHARGKHQSRVIAPVQAVEPGGHTSQEAGSSFGFSVGW